MLIILLDADDPGDIKLAPVTYKIGPSSDDTMLIQPLEFYAKYTADRNCSMLMPPVMLCPSPQEMVYMLNFIRPRKKTPEQLAKIRRRPLSRRIADFIDQTSRLIWRRLEDEDRVPFKTPYTYFPKPVSQWLLYANYGELLTRISLLRLTMTVSIVLFYVYMKICVTSFRLAQCRQLAFREWYVVGEPDVRCYDALHGTFSFISGAFTIVYLVGALESGCALVW
jgi:hypothetical protein